MGNHGETGAGRGEGPKKCASFALGPLLVRGRSYKERNLYSRVAVQVSAECSVCRIAMARYIYRQSAGTPRKEGRTSERTRSKNGLRQDPFRGVLLARRGSHSAGIRGGVLPGCRRQKGGSHDALVGWPPSPPSPPTSVRAPTHVRLGSCAGGKPPERLRAGLDGCDRAGGSGPGARACKVQCHP